MNSEQIAFQIIDWNQVPDSEHPGQTGATWWKTVDFPGLRIRIVEYSRGYLADHWCRKGHIVHCLDGEVVSEMEDGNSYLLKPGMTYVVSDEMSSHRLFSENGVKLLIIDGDFLK